MIDDEDNLLRKLGIKDLRDDFERDEADESMEMDNPLASMKYREVKREMNIDMGIELVEVESVLLV